MGIETNPDAVGRTAAEVAAADAAAGADEELPLLLVRVAKALVAEATATAENPSSGFTVAHAIAMRYVAGTDGPTTVGLAAHLHITKQSASEIVGALEEGGYVRRRPHPSDGRARIVELTSAGEAALARSRARWADIGAAWEGRAAAADLVALRRALEAYLDG